jgi:hypothetical protein
MQITVGDLYITMMSGMGDLYFLNRTAYKSTAEGLGPYCF